ncbi:hypothetical protein [Sedimenticola thiotaurini]|uniref:Uncharacterized protein n=1 Tax=Sedimenticola thiotaurini TaxID=1543721 RepID=A0A0F7JXV5_9GAMM|nr:hypothetical protein [Sedimenticola thiotaurini]AKH19610.1 hypothetical protein AAY24_03705 [Sedimenticola thiotaurini]
MIGPVDSKCAKRLCGSHRKVSSPASAGEADIFFNLCMDRVHYAPERHAIYFVDSCHVTVAETILAVLRGLECKPEIEQLYLDQLSIFKSLKRVKVKPEEARAVMVALRMQGMQITVSK